jgi:hypothetical protein
MTRLEILAGCMKMSGHNMYDSDWEKCMAFALVRERVQKLGDEFTLKDGVECEMAAAQFQAEFDKSIEDKSAK